MSALDKLTDDDIQPLYTVIDKMQTALAKCPHQPPMSEILNPKERHAIATLALAMDGPDDNSTANS